MMTVAIKKIREGERRLTGEERRGAAATRRGDDGGGVYRTVWRSRPNGHDQKKIFNGHNECPVQHQIPWYNFLFVNFFLLIIRKFNE